MKPLSKLTNPLLNFLFFETCLVCGEPNVGICRKCLEGAPKARLECLRCSKPNPFGLYCRACRKKNRPDFVLACFDYSGAVREAVHQFKYEDASKLAESFAPFLFKAARRISGCRKYSIVPIPLSSRKQRFRGFNQAFLLAKSLSGRSGLKVADILWRKDGPQSQVRSVSRKARRANVKGVFSLKRDQLAPKKIILLDDVITTGATVEEACKALKKAGAKEIIVLSLAM